MRKIKVLWLLACTICFLALAVGSLSLQKSIYLSRQNIAREKNFLKYGYEFSSLPLADVPEVLPNNLHVTDNSKSARSVKVLLYHGLVNKKDGYNNLTSEFKEHMLALKKGGYETITLDEFYQFRKGESTIPERAILLTFDDGRKDSFYEADPILGALGNDAALDVIAEHLEGKDHYLSDRELRYMINTGRWQIGSHGYAAHDTIPVNSEGDEGYFLSNKLWLIEEGKLESAQAYQKRIIDDLNKSRNALEERLGIDVMYFSFPFGDYGQRSLNYAHSADVILEKTMQVFELAFHQDGAVVFGSDYEAGDDGFMIDRIPVGSDWDGSDLLAALTQQ